MRSIFCLKLKKQSLGLEVPPFPGALGEKIFNQISREAWESWLGYQTMLINEYRLSLIDPKARQFLQEQMKDYLFSQPSEMKNTDANRVLKG